MKRPNILFLHDDEHRYDLFGFAGNPVVRTPFLDGLAKQSCVFKNAYTPSPVCIPGRQSMMCGQLPRDIGCERFGDDIAPFSLTFSRLFSEYGYHTTACGKLHHDGQDQMQGWTRRIGDDARITDKHMTFKEDISALNKQDIILADDHLPGSSKWNDVKEIKKAGVGRGPCHDADEYTVLGVQNYLRGKYDRDYYQWASPSRPLLLYVGLHNPHYPYFAEEEAFNYYLPRVKPFLGQQPFDHPYLGCSDLMLGKDKGPVTVGPDGHVTEEDVRRCTAAYYANCEKTDRQFAEVAAMLKEAEQHPDDWIVIYTSDHGEMLGEHSVWEKKKFFEASARVPLLIKMPGQQEQRIIDKNVNLCDLFATLCGLCDIPEPEGLYSRSLVPLMNGTAAGWDNETVSQMWGKHQMIKRDHLKYQYYEGMPEVLFDLERDPGETRDFSTEPGYADAMAAFRTRSRELGFGKDE